MTLKSLEDLAERGLAHDPELFAKCQPRRIIPPHGYPNPQLLSAMTFAYLCIRECGGERQEEGAGYALGASQFLKHSTPIYFLQNEFLRACMATEPPEGMTLADIKLPMSAFCLTLSWEVQRELFGGLWFPFILVANVPVGRYGVIGRSRVCNNTKPRFIVIGSAFNTDAEHTPVEFSSILPMETPLGGAIHDMGPVLDWNKKDKELKIEVNTLDGALQEMGFDSIEAYEANREELRSRKGLADITKTIEILKGQSSLLKKLKNQNLAAVAGLDFVIKGCKNKNESNQKLVATMNAVVIKTMLALSVRPELIEPELCLRKAKVKHNREKPALWSPIVIGKNYRIVHGKNGANPTGIVMKMHWRRGHFRNQVHGLARSQRKLIWIEPVLVNAE